jgi:glutamyl-Q tRNA(Asp) synthetase
VGYRGRFAPTPSGPLHFGSVVAAAGSRADALAHGGQWHLRIDDLDPPRVAPGAADAILRTLEALGMDWHGPVVWQSTRSARYAEALDALGRVAHLYGCSCSRREVEAAGLRGMDGPRYPGTCRDAPHSPGRPLAIRIDTRGATAAVDDLLQGHVAQNLEAEVGDFVLRRADGVHAYHLACVVDDADAGFDHVVRGADLLASTPRQAWLLGLLGLPAPAWLHLPVAAGPGGEKLSKQTLAAPVDVARPGTTLRAALAFLGHRPPDGLGRPAEIWEWVISRWDRRRLPRALSLPAVA